MVVLLLHIEHLHDSSLGVDEQRAAKPTAIIQQHQSLENMSFNLFQGSILGEQYKITGKMLQTSVVSMDKKLLLLHPNWSPRRFISDIPCISDTALERRDCPKQTAA